MLRVFVDASVIFAGCLSEHGHARDLLIAGLGAEVRLVANPFTLAEARRNLQAKGPPGLVFLDDLLALFAFEIVDTPPADVLAAEAVVEDKDAPIVAGAVAAGADWLATYNRRHLLAHAHIIQERFGLRVATPAEILGLPDS